MPLATHHYLLGSIVVGFAQVLDAHILLKLNGQRLLNLCTVSVSLLELVWAVVSYWMWASAEPPFPYWVPASYLAYMVAMTVAGFFFMPSSADEELRVPRQLLIFGGGFGAYFAVAASIAL